MANFIKNLLNTFKYKNILVQLIIVNVTVFLLLGIIKVFTNIFEIGNLDYHPYIEVSSTIKTTFMHCWVLITYMFVHYEPFHILFNMLMLYWFGKIFLMYFTPKNFFAVYILGGIAGALFYMLIFNTIPFFMKMNPTSMVGASAAVMAVIFGGAFYKKDQEVMMFFLGRVKIIYIALFIFALDFLALGGDSNHGGHVAHIGGALLGYVFAVQYKKGKDITQWFNRLIDKLVNLFTVKPKLRVKKQNTEKQDRRAPNQHQSANDASSEIDIILDKIKQSGYKSLSDSEKKRLFDASNK